MIQTPYGPKRSEMLCKAMDALERQEELAGALAELVQWCEDNFAGEDSGPDLSRAQAALEAIPEDRPMSLADGG